MGSKIYRSMIFDRIRFVPFRLSVEREICPLFYSNRNYQFRCKNIIAVYIDILCSQILNAPIDLKHRSSRFNNTCLPIVRRPSNYTLGLGSNSISIHVVDVTHSSPWIVNTYTLHIQRQERGVAPSSSLSPVNHSQKLACSLAQVSQCYHKSIYR